MLTATVLSLEAILQMSVLGLDRRSGKNRGLIDSRNRHIITRSRSAVSLKVPPTVPLANLVGDAIGERRPVGRCVGGSVTAGTTCCGWVLGRMMSIREHN